MVAKREATLNSKPRVGRTGVLDGMRKHKAVKHWAKVRRKAKRFIKIMEDAGKVPAVVVPGTPEAMAKAALEEAFVLAVGAGDAKIKSQNLRLVLDFTMAKPESKTKLTLDKSEEWLNALEADMSNGRPASDPTPTT